MIKDKWFIGLSVGVVVVPIFIVASILLIRENKTSDYGTKQLVEELDKEQAKMKEINASMDSNQVEHPEEVPELLELMKKYEDPKEAATYLFAVIEKKDVSLYIDAFHPNVVAKDIATESEPDKKQALVKQIISRISRNESLEQISIKEVQVKEQKARVYLKLKYKDGQVNTSMELILVNVDNHTNQKIYVVNTSSWLIIRDIEKKLGKME